MKHMLATSVILLAAGLAGCNKSEQTANSVAASARNAADTAGAAASNAMVDVEQAMTPTPNGQGFADKAGKSDAFEIAAANLAKTNADSAEVKKFAATMIEAHTGSTAKIKAAAAKATPAIKPDPMLTSDQQSKLDDLAKLKGADFDKAYIDNQVSAHEDALSLMKNYADNGDTPSLKAAAGEIAPVVQKHLDMAKALKK